MREDRGGPWPLYASSLPLAARAVEGGAQSAEVHSRKDKAGEAMISDIAFAAFLMLAIYAISWLVFLR